MASIPFMAACNIAQFLWGTSIRHFSEGSKVRNGSEANIKRRTRLGQLPYSGGPYAFYRFGRRS